MKHKVRKLFYDYELEEKWLNEMSAKGLHLIYYSWAQYIFEEDPHKQYQYRIELLKESVSNPESIVYLKFLKENDIEHVASYMRWIYLRKDVANGEFDLYTDKASKIVHYRRIYNVWNTLMVVEAIVGVINVGVGFINLVINEKLGNFSYGNISLGVTCLIMSFLFWRLRKPLYQKIKKLKQEQMITE